MPNSQLSNLLGFQGVADGPTCCPPAPRGYSPGSPGHARCRRRRRARLRGPLRPASPGAARLLPPHGRLAARRPRTRCSRRSCAPTAGWRSTGRPRSRARGCSPDRAQPLQDAARRPPRRGRGRRARGRRPTGSARRCWRAPTCARWPTWSACPTTSARARARRAGRPLPRPDREVIGVRSEKVKGLIHQARTTLIAERDARERRARRCASSSRPRAAARCGAGRCAGHLRSARRAGTIATPSPSSGARSRSCCRSS